MVIRSAALLLNILHLPMTLLNCWLRVCITHLSCNIYLVNLTDLTDVINFQRGCLFSFAIAFFLGWLNSRLWFVNTEWVSGLVILARLNPYDLRVSDRVERLTAVFSIIWASFENGRWTLLLGINILIRSDECRLAYAILTVGMLNSLDDQFRIKDNLKNFTLYLHLLHSLVHLIHQLNT